MVRVKHAQPGDEGARRYVRMDRVPPRHRESGAPLRGIGGAAASRRAARQRGLTVRSTVHCLIAAVAIRTGTPVLTRDRNYFALAQVSALEIVAAR